MKEAASLEDTKVREGEGERGMSKEERWAEEDGRGGCGERKSGEGGWSFTRESLEERSVVTIAGMFGAAGDMTPRGRGSGRVEEKDYIRVEGSASAGRLIPGVPFGWLHAVDVISEWNRTFESKTQPLFHSERSKARHPRTSANEREPVLVDWFKYKPSVTVLAVLLVPVAARFHPSRKSYISHFGAQIIIAARPSGRTPKAATSCSPPTPEPPRLLSVFDDVSSLLPHARLHVPRALLPFSISSFESDNHPRHPQ